MQKNKKVNKKQLKKLQKRKKKEAIAKQKELLRIQKEQNKREKEELKRRTKIKNREKYRARNKALKILFAFFAIIFLIILFILSPVFYIKDVKVSGNSKVSENTILSLASIPENTNIFKVTNSYLKKKIKENAYIDNVTSKKILPSTLYITVTERTPKYSLVYGSSFAYIDENGYILEISKENIEGQVKISGYVTSEEIIIPGNRLCQDDLQSLADISQILKSAESSDLEDKITTITIKQNEYSLYLESEGKTIEIGDTSNLETKLLYAKEILNKTKGENGVIHVNVDLNTKRAYFTKNT